MQQRLHDHRSLHMKYFEFKHHWMSIARRRITGAWEKENFSPETFVDATGMETSNDEVASLRGWFNKVSICALLQVEYYKAMPHLTHTPSSRHRRNVTDSKKAKHFCQSPVPIADGSRLSMAMASNRKTCSFVITRHHWQKKSLGVVGYFWMISLLSVRIFRAVGSPSNIQRELWEFKVQIRLSTVFGIVHYQSTAKMLGRMFQRQV